MSFRTTSVSLTGAGGFLGWHTRCAAHAQGLRLVSVLLGDRFDLPSAVAAIEGTARLIHIAGVNRGPEGELLAGNIRFAEQLASALDRVEAPPRVVVFANSTQAGNDSAYGRGKWAASELLRVAAQRRGAGFVDLRLPNLFGEHGRPFYNSVVATFVHQIVKGERPTVDVDRELTLLHAQNAADVLLGTVEPVAAETEAHHETVSGLLSRLKGMAAVYSSGGEIPDIQHPFDRDLFNTLRAAAFPSGSPIPLKRNADARGSFFEILRVRGGAGQSSFSTTVPGITRGQHYHRRKVERFTVLAGEATIGLRRMFTDQAIELRLRGDQPGSVDMPTMWTHNIANVGETDLYTTFWSNELFDPAHPDTIAEVV